MTWEQEKERFGREIIRGLYREGMIRTWYRDRPDGWRLMSGLWSPFYIQLRPLSCYPALLKQVGEGLGMLIQNEIPAVNRCVGIAMAGIPIATAISLMKEIPSGFTRKLEGVHTLEELRSFIAGYGEHALVEGIFEEGDHIALVDDLATKFDSKIIALEQVWRELERRQCAQVTVRDVVVLLDREQGAAEAARAWDVRLHALIPFRSRGLDWLAGTLSKEEHRVLTDYLNAPENYQDPAVQERLRDQTLDAARNGRKPSEI
jgi:orotate phosphoribosyltransferase